MDFVALKTAIAGQIRVGAHGIRGLQSDGLGIDDVRAAIQANGDLIEDYPNDPRGPSCLVLCVLPDGRQVHTCWAYQGADEPFLITAYCPTPDRFLPDGRTRVRRDDVQ